MKKTLTNLAICTCVAGCAATVPEPEPSLTQKEIALTLPDVEYNCKIEVPKLEHDGSLESFYALEKYIDDGKSDLKCVYDKKMSPDKIYDSLNLDIKCNVLDFVDAEKFNKMTEEEKAAEKAKIADVPKGIYYDGKIFFDSPYICRQEQKTLAQRLEEIDRCGLSGCGTTTLKDKQRAILATMFSHNDELEEYNNVLNFVKERRKDVLTPKQLRKITDKFNDILTVSYNEIMDAQRTENPVLAKKKQEKATEKYKAAIAKWEKENKMRLRRIKNLAAVVQRIDMNENGKVDLKLDLDIDVKSSADAYDGNYEERYLRNLEPTDEIAALSVGQKVYVNGIFYYDPNMVQNGNPDCSTFAFPACLRLEGINLSAETQKEAQARQKKLEQARANLKKKAKAVFEKNGCAYLDNRPLLGFSPYEIKALSEVIGTSFEEAFSSYLDLLKNTADNVGIDNISCATKGDVTEYSVNGNGYYFKKSGKNLILLGRVESGRKYQCDTVGNEPCKNVAEQLLMNSDPRFAAMKQAFGMAF